MFTWKPIYREIAQALMPYKGRQADLLAIVKEMQQDDLPVISIMDRDAAGAEVELGGCGVTSSQLTLGGNWRRVTSPYSTFKIT